tara:strand:- start:154 stop:384 length:231 start_codon:yes stop_codon:yes gene_type:complete
VTHQVPPEFLLVVVRYRLHQLLLILLLLVRRGYSLIKVVYFQVVQMPFSKEIKHPLTIGREYIRTPLPTLNFQEWA